MNLQGLARLFASSKGLVFLGIVTAGMVLVLAGKLDAQVVWGKIVEMSWVLFGAVAAEDVSKNMAARPRSPAVQQNVNMPPTTPPPPPPEDDRG